MQVQKNWTSSRVPRPESLTWDKLFRRFLAFLTMESMWEFHFKSLETLRPSILALATNSVGMPLTTTGSKDVVFLVLKLCAVPCLSSRLVETYPRKRGWPGCHGGLDVTVLVLAYCLRNSRIVDVFPEIDGRNIKLVDHEDEQPWPQSCASGNPRPYNTPF